MNTGHTILSWLLLIWAERRFAGQSSFSSVSTPKFISSAMMTERGCRKKRSHISEVKRRRVTPGHGPRDDRPWLGQAPPGMTFTYAPGRASKCVDDILRGFNDILQVESRTPASLAPLPLSSTPTNKVTSKRFCYGILKPRWEQHTAYLSTVYLICEM